MHKVEVIDIDEDGILTSTGIPEFFSEKEIKEGKEMILTRKQWVGLTEFFIRNSLSPKKEEWEEKVEEIVNEFLLFPIPLVENLKEFVEDYFKKGEKDMEKKSGFKIERYFGGNRYVIELTNEELEKAFRFRDKEYMKEDARRQFFDYFGLDVDDYYEEELENVQEKIDKNGGKFKFRVLANDDETLEYFVSEFSENQDCNAAENDIWQNVIRDFLRTEYSYNF